MNISDLELEEIQLDIANQLLVFAENITDEMVIEWTEFGECYIPVRLQWFSPDQYNLHFFDSSYDTDHRGHWGSSSVYPGLELGDALYIASSLINQVLDSVMFS